MRQCRAIDQRKVLMKKWSFGDGLQRAALDRIENVAHPSYVYSRKDNA
jgi:hypothetical protein